LGAIKEENKPVNRAWKAKKSYFAPPMTPVQDSSDSVSESDLSIETKSENN
jgi:hypothetical protein